MRDLDLKKESIMWHTREPYPVFRMKNNKVLNQKYVLDNNLEIEGTYDVELMIGKMYRFITNAELTTIDNHTVISKYL